ncbi:MAG: hypothetical protein U0T84_12210 [Chitinophagales bacterium]
MTAPQGIKQMIDLGGFVNTDIQELSFLTIKENIVKQLPYAAPNDQHDFGELKAFIRNHQKGDKWWYHAFNTLCTNSYFNKFAPNKISEVDDSVFSSLNVVQMLALYEMAAQTETKIIIGDWENQVLVLAGRYAVYLKKQELQNLLR